MVIAKIEYITSEPTSSDSGIISRGTLRPMKHIAAIEQCSILMDSDYENTAGLIAPSSMFGDQLEGELQACPRPLSKLLAVFGRMSFRQADSGSAFYTWLAKRLGVMAIEEHCGHNERTKIGN